VSSYDADCIEKVKYLIVKKKDSQLVVFDKKESVDYNTIPAVTTENYHADLGTDV
jgi:hypothetical protein